MFAALLSSITFLNQAPADIDKKPDLGGVREEHIPKENFKEFQCPVVVQLLSPYTCTLDKGGNVAAAPQIYFAHCVQSTSPFWLIEVVSSRRPQSMIFICPSTAWDVMTQPL